MKKAIKLTLAFALVMGSTTLFAQKFGRINTQEIIMSMPETKTMQENMETFAKELQDLQNRSREFQERAQQDYQKKQNELLAPIIDKAKAAIDKISAANAYTVVFDTSTGSLAYFDEATLTDIAPLVKKELGITDAPAAPAK